tara:strand:- start:393 stop:683 length:291 start_codon:yes stop_codon:yes gene_type:complete
MKKLLLVLVLMFVVIGIVLLFPSEPCAEFSDSSQKASCYADLALETGDLSYCSHYWFDDCLNEVDPLYEGSVEGVCEGISDTSRMEDCFEFVDENY